MTRDAALSITPEFSAGIEPRISIGHLIRRAQQFNTKCWIDEFGSELTGPQYAVLAAVARWAGIDQTRAGELASLDKSTGADVINRLTSMGWLIRVNDTGDRRKRVLRLSSPARAALRDITPRVQKVHGKLLAGFTAGDAGEFIRLLAKVAYRSTSDVGPEPTQTDADVIGISTAPGHLLRRSLQVHTQLWGTFVGEDLTGPQYAVLATLIRHGEMDQKRLGELASLDKSVVGDVVDRLSRKKWLTKDRDPADGRRRILHVSDEGRDVVRRASPGVSEVQESLMKPLSAKESVDLIRMLTRIPDATGPSDGA